MRRPTRTDPKVAELTRIFQTLLRARGRGATLRQAATAAGLHVATVCRWQRADPRLRKMLADAAESAQRLRRQLPPERPMVRWRRDCPQCRVKVVVRTTRGGARFWRCGRWP